MENQEQYYLNDYQMNKACPDAIVYPDENGNPVKYTADSFASQEEFKRWKKWSDRSYADIESAYHKLYHKAPTPKTQELFRDICAKSIEELKSLYDSQRNTEAFVGDQLITYIEDGVNINTKNVTDVAARIREKMSKNQ